MDLSQPDDTICAIATAVGEAGIGILKLSGPRARSITQRIFKPSRPLGEWHSHRLRYGWIIDPASGESIDEVLVSYMRAPTSYTGEDVVEINCHSGYAVLNRMLALVLDQGARLAEPGEFTRRAFLNGRIDLTQAEAVCEVIRSQSERSLHLAGRQLSGEFRRRVERWHRILLDLQARLEATLDFPEDTDDEPELPGLLAERLRVKIIEPLGEILTHYQSHRMLREGLAVVLVGRPNVGKSSLLNRLVGRDRAIVTPLPGTTRDVVEDSFFLGGIRVRVLDTAGIRHQPDMVESLGIERTLHSVDEADLVIWLIDRSQPLTREDDSIYRKIREKPNLVLLNKADLAAAIDVGTVRARYRNDEMSVYSLSAIDEIDVQRFRKHLEQFVLPGNRESKDCPFIPNVRQQLHLQRAQEAAIRTESLATRGAYPELISDELSIIRKELKSILGLDADSEVLERIFSQFCIGK